MMNPTTSDLAIDLRNVSKMYRGRVHALRGIDMRVHAGEVFGLLGPNGAGKSTLVKIIMTVIRPTQAVGTVLGSAVGHKPTLARIGYLPENHRFPRYLTGRQTLDFFAALAGVPRAGRRRKAGELLDLVGMSAWGDKRIGTYSKGMMQRVGLAQAMMNDPDLILLDEPTDGVDPVGRREIRDVLATLRAAGKTVFINSHLLSELEMICDRVAILVGGAVAKQGTIDELAIAKQCYAIELAGLPLPPLVEAVRLAVGSAISIDVNERTIQLGTTEANDVQPALDVLRAGGAVIRRVVPVRPSLEDLFMEAVREQFGGGNGAAVPVGATPGAPRAVAGAPR